MELSQSDLKMIRYHLVYYLHSACTLVMWSATRRACMGDSQTWGQADTH